MNLSKTNLSKPVTSFIPEFDYLQTVSSGSRLPIREEEDVTIMTTSRSGALERNEKDFSYISEQKAIQTEPIKEMTLSSKNMAIQTELSQLIKETTLLSKHVAIQTTQTTTPSKHVAIQTIETTLLSKHVAIQTIVSTQETIPHLLPPSVSDSESSQETTNQLLRGRLTALEEDFYELLASHQELTEQLKTERRLNEHMSQELQTIPEYISIYRHEREEFTTKLKEQQQALQTLSVTLDQVTSNYHRLKYLIHQSSSRKRSSLQAMEPSSDSILLESEDAALIHQLEQRELPKWWWSLSTPRSEEALFPCHHCAGKQFHII
jgi:hypothetical protein